MKATLDNPYPTTFEEFLNWFESEADCRTYLEWIRWPDGFVCPPKLGRVRFQCVDTADAETIEIFVKNYIQAGSIIVTDGLSAYSGLRAAGFDHHPHVISTGGKAAREQLDHVHLVISLLKRWLVGTHQGAVTPAHLQGYLDEFAFRFNRRLSARRGKLFHRLIQQSVTLRPKSIKNFYSNEPQDMGGG